ncbi:MAG: 50S ribosomal protein L25 [Candidatus Dormibacteraeota bacterium]|uniref:Large ribosomal subunit protein bL25 n=1 Tax=Candidatus Dormiibacter inghamiae TaxID=3127013 RepID=A0A934NCH4_9BACT|nr:50S ribosomal protein L25 [Candidatus Dormibacteraeota bacterium]MBJ7607014.1 50S ribosomal protein L25 [Candidatus Dormibacteraeota bacterium]
MQLNANKRDSLGKASRKLRHQGLLPAVLYGHHTKAFNLQLDAREFGRVFARVGRTSLIDLVIDDGRPHKVLVKEIQHSPRWHHVVHVDFHQVSLREKLQVEVPVTVSGLPAPVDAGDADVLHVLHNLKVECLPTDIPDVVDVDISGLKEIDEGIRVGDLRLPPGVSVVDDPEEMVVKLTARRDMVAELAAEEAAEGQAEEPAEAGEEEAAEEHSAEGAE